MRKSQIIDKIQAAQALLRIIEADPDTEEHDAKHTAMSLLETAKYDLEEYNAKTTNQNDTLA